MAWSGSNETFGSGAASTRCAGSSPPSLVWCAACATATTGTPIGRRTCAHPALPCLASAGVHPFEWMELPNTLGMSQFADGGLLATKPYVSSAAYIDRMSDYWLDTL